MSNTIFIGAGEVAQELGISIAYAYKLVKQLNSELEAKGFITIAGRTSRKYFQEKIYGVTARKGETYACIQN
jgi:hypothetical protein